jgi:hypothetical protein
MRNSNLDPGAFFLTVVIKGVKMMKENYRGDFFKDAIAFCFISSSVREASVGST